jgi:hypothetical protein
MGEKCRLNEPARIADPLAAGCECRPVGLADADIVGDLVEMHLVDQRPHFGRRVKRVADPNPVDPLGKSGLKLVGDGFLHQKPARGCAAFAIERVDHEDRGIERAVEIGVIEDNDRVLAAQFEMNAL